MEESEKSDFPKVFCGCIIHWWWVSVGGGGGGGADVALKHCVYEAVNQQRLFHASRVQIVHESGRIIKKGQHK